jgi:Arc/MetJ-type ribon-helix-helix transcriptional regulator
MVRTQVQLTEEQARRLREAAARQGVSIADLVRQGVDFILDRETLPSRDELVQRAIAAADLHRSSHRDVAEKHDQYLAEAFTE